MTPTPHRNFREHYFIKKFLGHEEVLWAYLELFEGRLPALPSQPSVQEFIEYLQDPPTAGPDFDAMLEGLHTANDLSNRQGGQNYACGLLLWHAG